MLDAMPVAELLFTDEDATPMSTDTATIKSWSRARESLASAPKVWLSTVRPDGRPHVMPLLLVWIDEAPSFATRPTSRKARNLNRDPHCVLTAANEDLDLVVEGRATRATDEIELRRVAAAFQNKYEWELTVRNGVVHDHGLAGSPEYSLYQVTPTRAFGYGADGLTATRWRFT